MAGYFFMGFITAAVLMAMLLFLASFLKRAGADKPNIKGYLDLIPDLTEAQRQKVRNIRETFLPKVEGIRQDLCRLRLELARALFSEPTDRNRIQSISQSILTRQSELEWEVIEHILEERELLDPKQQRQFHDIILRQFAQGGLGVHDVKGRSGA